MSYHRLSELSMSFLQAMVMAMYAFEAKQHLNPHLLTETEMQEFYLMYCGASK